MTDDRPNTRALQALDATISNLQSEAWDHAKAYVIERDPARLAKMRDLKEAAGLLAWARGGSPLIAGEDGWPT